MKSVENYSVTIIALDNEVYTIPFKRHEYPSLMELITNNYYEDIGDCRGRGLCGTCHVKLVSKHEPQPIDINEKMTLSKLNGIDNTSRLACQIMLNETLHNKTYKIITEYNIN
jgi:2Fe-2S ferredoxin